MPLEALPAHLVHLGFGRMQQEAWTVLLCVRQVILVKLKEHTMTLHVKSVTMVITQTSMEPQFVQHAQQEDFPMTQE